MKEEASHLGRNRVGDREKGRKDREHGGNVYERKKGNYLRNFCETEALVSSTCLDIVLTTIPMPKAIMVRFMTFSCLVMYLHLKKILPVAFFVP